MLENDILTTRLTDLLQDLNVNLDKLISEKNEKIGIYFRPNVDYSKIIKETNNLSSAEERQNRNVINGYRLRYELLLDFYKKYGSLLRNYGKKYADEAIKIFPQYSEIANIEVDGIKGYFLEKIKDQDLYGIVQTYYNGALKYYGNTARSFMLKILSDLRDEDFGKNFFSSSKYFKEIDNIFNKLKQDYKSWNNLIESTGDISLSKILVYGGKDKDALSYLTTLNDELKKITLEYEGKELSFLDISKMNFDAYNLLSAPTKKIYENLKNQLETLQYDLLSSVVEISGPINLDEKFENIYKHKLSSLDTLLSFGLIDNAQYDKYKDIFGKEFQDNLTNVNRKLIQLDDIWKSFFNIEDKSFGQLKDALGYAEQLLNNAVLSPNSTKQRALYDTFFVDENNLKKSFEITKGELKEISDIYFKILKNLSSKNPFAALFKSLKGIFEKEKKIGDEIIPKNWEEIFKDFGTGLGGISSILASFSSDLSKMFNVLGDAKTASTFTDLSNILSGISTASLSFATGNLIGGISATFGVVTGFLTSIFEKHDAKLKEQIEESKKVVAELQKEREEIERTIERGLGGAYGGTGRNAYTDLLEKMKKEQEEYKKQLEDAENIKNDEEREQTKADIEAEMAELDDQVRHFAEDTLKDLMGIDLKDWASQIGDSLVDAFANGEDAAAAFDKTVGDIIKNVVKNMASLYILEPLLRDLQVYLFGEDGKSGVFGSDRHFSEEDLKGMMPYLDAIKNEGVPAVEELFKGIDTGLGGLLSMSANMEGLSGGIKSITEDTANLLASYLNAVRADVALLAIANPRMTTIAESQLTQLTLIATNTSRSAVAVEAIINLLRSVTTTTSSGRVLKI